MIAGTSTILLVEDDTDLREVVADVLRASAYTVLTAANADDARRVSRSEPGTIHVLLTDVFLPGMSGVDLTAILQRERSGIRALFMSGSHDHRLLARIASEGQELLEKPFTPKALEDAIRRLIV